MARPGSSRAVVASRRLYRALLRAYPAGYRREWSDSMEQLFADCAEDAFACSGMGGLALLWARTAWDLTISLAREYRRREPLAAAHPVSAQLRPMENFTPRAQQALAIARREAGRLGTPYVGTEHLLLGILRLDQNVGRSVLTNLGVDLGELRAAIEARIGVSQPGPDRASFPFTPRVKRVLAVAGKTAHSWNHNYVGCEHMLVSLTLVDGLAHDVLGDFGVTPDRCRLQTEKVLSQQLKSVPAVLPERATGVPARTFVGVGRCIRSNAAEQVHGHVEIVLIFVAPSEGKPAIRVHFSVDDSKLPGSQWPIVQRAIQGWWELHRPQLARWVLVAEIRDASVVPGAEPAFGRAAAHAMQEAANQASAAGLIPSFS